jgi:hypothetical protein
VTAAEAMSHCSDSSSSEGNAKAAKKATAAPLYSIYKADGTIQKDISLPDGRKHFELEEMKKIVGGWVEVSYLPGKMIAIYDEEGKMQHKSYPINLKASELVGLILVGTVIICPEKMMK